jgi:phosphoglycolate phosphatase-like HAD superfamily hydrolase
MDDNILYKIRNFGALNYAPERIADLLGYVGEERRKLFIELADEQSQAAVIYRQGQGIGKYNIDVELLKNAEKGVPEAIDLLDERQRRETVINLKKELFGIV